jgi:hypothetical protein
VLGEGGRGRRREKEKTLSSGDRFPNKLCSVLNSYNVGNEYLSLHGLMVRKPSD